MKSIASTAICLGVSLAAAAGAQAPAAARMDIARGYYGPAGQACRSSREILNYDGARLSWHRQRPGTDLIQTIQSVQRIRSLERDLPGYGLIFDGAEPADEVEMFVTPLPQRRIGIASAGSGEYEEYRPCGRAELPAWMRSRR